MDGWTASSEWKVVGGKLVSDGTDNDYSTAVAMAPFQPSTADYAVVARIGLTAQPPGYASCVFGLEGRVQEQGGYYAGYRNQGQLILASGSNGYPTLGSQPYTPDVSAHVYRLEVRQNQLSLQIDGKTVMQAADNRFLQPGRVGVWDLGCQVEVTDFHVVRLSSA